MIGSPVPRPSPRVNPLDLDATGPAPSAGARAAAAHRETRASSGVAVITRDGTAEALLDPTRRRILEGLHEPGSATSVAASLGLSRQAVNYHVRALERAGLVEEVARRRRRGVQERIVRATAAHYIISPNTLGSLGRAEGQSTDRFSSTFQVAVAARTIREVAALSERARRAGKRLTTLTLDTSVRFATPAAREAFANELVCTISALVAKYHDGLSPDGRSYRLFAGAHPVFERTDK